MNRWKRGLAVLLAVLMTALTGCTGNTEPSTDGSQTTSETAQTESQVPDTTAAETETPMEISSIDWPTSPESLPALKLDKLEEALNWVGKLAKNAGIPNDCIKKGDALWEVNVEGLLFEKEATGLIELLEDPDGPRVDRVHLFCPDLSYGEAKAILTGLYGKPVEEKTDTTGQTDQGIVTYCVFENGENEVWLSKGTEEDFTRVEAI